LESLFRYKLHEEGIIFQAELCGIRMAIDWIQNQRKKASTYTINVDSKTFPVNINSLKTIKYNLMMA
jgi:hypothetical protein